MQNRPSKYFRCEHSYYWKIIQFSKLLQFSQFHRYTWNSNCNFKQLSNKVSKPCLIKFTFYLCLYTLQNSEQILLKCRSEWKFTRSSSMCKISPQIPTKTSQTQKMNQWKEWWTADETLFISHPWLCIFQQVDIHCAQVVFFNKLFIIK